MELSDLNFVNTMEVEGKVVIQRTGRGIFSGVLVNVPRPSDGKLGSKGELIKLTLPDGKFFWVTVV